MTVHRYAISPFPSPMLFKRLLTVGVISLSVHLESATAACCVCPIGKKCNDGSSCTNTCGVGSCNVFGCACQGGCKGSADELGTRTDDSELHSNCIATDTDRDGKITFTEWVNSPARTVLIGVDDNTLAQYWAKFDTANAGYLTDDEATNRLA